MAKAKVNLESQPFQVVDLLARQHVLDSVPADAAEIPARCCLQDSLAAALRVWTTI